MGASAIELYVAAFLARCDANWSPGRPKISQPGVRGLLAGSEDSSVRVLVTDDRAHDVLAELLLAAWTGMISILAGAERCLELVGRRQVDWRRDVVTAMVCRDLRALPAVSMPQGLAVRPVRRLEADDPGGVALGDAVATAISAAAAIEDPPDALAEFLRSLPSTFRLLAAVDDDGVVRATSGYGVFDQHATIIFVNTDRGWRRRGIGQTMTSHALHAARRSGATYACLDASAAAGSIYRRLGFETAGTVTRFVHSS